VAPLSAVFSTRRGLPRVSAKPVRGTARPSEKADAVIFWQSVQWHAKPNSGWALTR
jgi:hypothetical protein